MKLITGAIKHFIRGLLWVSVIHSGILFSAPVVNLKTSYYDITGTDIVGIHKSLQQKGLLAKNGKRYHASTQWNISWNYRWIESKKQCRLNKTETSVNVDMLLPRLRNRDRLNENMRSTWDRYLTALTAHEKQHQAFGLQAATEIEQLLRNTPAMDCFALETRLNNQAEQILNKYKTLEESFDRETEHGARDGVLLQ